MGNACGLNEKLYPDCTNEVTGLSVDKRFSPLADRALRHISILTFKLASCQASRLDNQPPSLQSNQVNTMKFAGVIASMGLLGVAAAGCSDDVYQSSPEQQSTPTETPAATTATTSSFARFFDQDRFHAMFPDAIDLYNFDGLVNAANKYTAFANTGNDTNDKRELAAFLAQTAHESDNFKAAEEYARNTYTVWQYCDNTTYPCAPGRRYHGRGPIQLSWNYNYYNAGQALGIDLLDNPDIVANDTAVTWMTALWYWMTPQGGRIIHDVVAGVNGFAQSTDIINGALECGPSAPNKINEQQRIKYFTKMCEALDVQPLGNSSCNA